MKTNTVEMKERYKSPLLIDVEATSIELGATPYCSDCKINTDSDGCCSKCGGYSYHDTLDYCSHDDDLDR